MSERLYCSARRAETAQGGEAGHQGSAPSLHEVNENLLSALAVTALRLIKRHADISARPCTRTQRNTQVLYKKMEETAHMHEQQRNLSWDTTALDALVSICLFSLSFSLSLHPSPCDLMYLSLCDRPQQMNTSFIPTSPPWPLCASNQNMLHCHQSGTQRLRDLTPRLIPSVLSHAGHTTSNTQRTDEI